MVSMKNIVTLLVAVCCVCAFSNSANAHSAFKKALAAKYPGKKISCDACHVKGEKKSVRNTLGKLYYNQFKDKKLTETHKSKSGAEKKAFETEVMVPEFKKAMEAVDKMTVADLIKAGVFGGITEEE